MTNTNPLGVPPFIPCWMGAAPICFYIDPSMEFCRDLILLALETWRRERTADNKPLRLCFSETKFVGQGRTIEFRLGPLIGLLGLAMYPPPLITEPYSGNIIINNNVNWQDPRWHDLLLPLLIHEVGHALGLPESYFAESVMCPNIDYRKVNLALVDKIAVRTLYGS